MGLGLLLHSTQQYRMAGNFGGLLTICHLTEFTLVVELVLAIMIFIAMSMANRMHWEFNQVVS